MTATKTARSPRKKSPRELKADAAIVLDAEDNAVPTMTTQTMEIKWVPMPMKRLKALNVRKVEEEAHDEADNFPSSL